MKKIILLSFLSFMFPSVYVDGDIVSIEHQNIEKETCYPGNGYDLGDNWSLADWNGNINGGSYNVTFVDMSSTW